MRPRDDRWCGSNNWRANARSLAPRAASLGSFGCARELTRSLAQASCSHKMCVNVRERASFFCVVCWFVIVSLGRSSILDFFFRLL